ncbi:uncharacterized protein BDFB_003431 [Asbolus verrucosus]|uniref:Uncharacterized protein n=1 Tax=Asbolus verrucosus TaxID=1661398 RepID=A0A482V1U4_ASBVE|nr:uncharacterized protein BDFB_003431 [Asbolus verrucosus]
MDSNIHEIETVFVPGVDEQAFESNWFEVEQTEPLNLCLNGSVINGFAMVEYYPDLKESGNLSEGSDDDVIFVKEYKVSNEKTVKKITNEKKLNKGAPRRNPEISENFSTKNEDSEDWKVENVLRKGKRKRKVIAKKMPNKYCRVGRRRKCNKSKINEKKVPIKELEQLIASNLSLVKNYVNDVKAVTKMTNKENLRTNERSDRTKNAINILKQQMLLLAVTTDTDVSMYLTD